MSWNYRGVQLTDHAEDLQESWLIEDDRSEYTRVFDVAWSDREYACQQLVGYSETLLSAGGKKFCSRTTPMGLKDWQIDQIQAVVGSRDYLYCTQVRGQGVAATAGTAANPTKDPQYQLARLSARFQTLPYDILTDAQMIQLGYVDSSGNPDEATLRRYVIVNPKPSGEFFSIKSNSYLYVADQTAVTQGIGKLLVYANLAITRIGVPWDSMPSFHCNRNLVAPGPLDLGLGTVNKDGSSGLAADPEFVNYAPGSLLFTALEIKPRRSAFGVRIYDYTCFFKWFQQGTQVVGAVTFAKGHQFLFKPYGNNTGWIEVTIGGATNLTNNTAATSIYDWTTFANFFRNP